jgi:hypothetical protein
MCLIQIRLINIPMCILTLESSAPWDPTRNPHLAVVGIVDHANKLRVQALKEEVISRRKRRRMRKVGGLGEDGRGRFLGEVRVGGTPVWLV